MSTESLEEELSIPGEASLVPEKPGHEFHLTMSGGGEVVVGLTTSLRVAQEEKPRCLVVGRQASTADLRIQHKSISRRHAALYYYKDQFTLQDLGGKHGVCVNGNRVASNSSVVLGDGDVIQFGNVRDNLFSVKAAAPEPIKETSKTEESDNESETIQAQAQQPEPGAGLTGRAKREAEIQAVMASFDQKPIYQKYNPTTDQSSDALLVDSKANVKSRSREKSATAERNFGLPVSETFSVSYQGDAKRCIVSGLAVDTAGSRFIAGGTDMVLRFYDFAGLDSHRMDPFKSVVVEDGHVIVDVCYSNTGDRILVGTGSVQPKVLDRDGHEIIQFVRGDVYVTDPARTSGHTAAVTGVSWHPLERDIVLTSSIDGSARTWNLNGKTQFQKLVCDKVYRSKNQRGQRVAATSVAFAPGGRELAFGTACGSIQIWSALKVGARPERVVFDAHGNNKAIHSLVYNADGTRLASRSMGDDTVKVWEVRKLSKSASPLVTCTGLPCEYEHCNSAFSPDGRVICAGSAELVKKPSGQRQEVGKLKFYRVPQKQEDTTMEDSSGSDPFLELDVGVGVVVVRWHAKLNQIFAGCTDGSVTVYFDRDRSSKGALLSAAKSSRPVDELSRLLASRAPTGSAGVRGEILTPNALPMFRDKEGDKKRKRKDREDPTKSHQPEPPSAGIKTGGQSSVQINFTQFVSKSIVRNKNIAGKDPREELFKYSDGKTYASQAYEGDKERVLADTTVEQEEEEIRAKKSKDNN